MIDDRSARRFARLASAVAILLGASVLLGWVFDIAVLKSVLPGLTVMHVSSAVAFVFAGISLRLQLEPNSQKGRIAIAAACALLVVALGVLTLGEYTYSIDLGIDRLSFYAREAPSIVPERMAPNTALNFSLLGAALLLLDKPSQVLRTVSQILFIAVLFIAFVAITGYVLSANALYGVPGYSAMALHTAVGFAVLSVGALLARPRRRVIAILLQDNPGGVTARRVLPVIVVTLLAVGWLRLKGQEAGFYGTEFGLALTIAVCSSVFAAVVLWNARVQGRDEKRWQETARNGRADRGGKGLRDFHAGPERQDRDVECRGRATHWVCGRGNHRPTLLMLPHPRRRGAWQAGAAA